MLKKIIISLVILIAGLAAFIASRPSEFRVSRSTTISAPPAAVFAQVNDLHKWEAWSPWGKLDPEMKRTYSGPAYGVGAVYSWSGNNQVGVGSTTITQSRPDDLIKMKLEFLKPFKGTNDVEFTFKTAGTQTITSWTMSGKNNFLSKAMGIFMNCEKMVGGQFDKGLMQLKEVVEKS